MRLKPMTPLVLLAVMFSSQLSRAEDLARVVALGGFGSTTTKNEVAASEGPFDFQVAIDYTVHSKFIVGAEHIRTIGTSPPASSISYTGLSGRFYFPNNAPNKSYDLAGIPDFSMMTEDLATYFGGSFGFAQSSLLPDKNGKSSNAAGLYASFKVGLDYQLSGRWGARSELNIAQTLIGTGSISSMMLFIGIYMGL